MASRRWRVVWFTLLAAFLVVLFVQRPSWRLRWVQLKTNLAGAWEGQLPSRQGGVWVTLPPAAAGDLGLCNAKQLPSSSLRVTASAESAAPYNRSELCAPLRHRGFPDALMLPAATCRLLALSDSNQDSGTELSRKLCGTSVSSSLRKELCSQEPDPASVPSSRVMSPYARPAPMTYYLWNKALATWSDVSPRVIVDDSPSLEPEPYADIRPGSGTGIAGTQIPVLYVVTTQLPAFVQDVLPSIKGRFILITGCSDVSAPVAAVGMGTATTVLQDARLIAWFAQNCDLVHEKVVPLPIGIDFHTLAIPNIQTHDWGEPQSVQQQEADLLSLRCSHPPFADRPVKALMNFNTAGRGARAAAAEALAKVDGVVKVEKISRRELWRMYGDVSFIISPRGFGKDCHRTWEALALGCAVVASYDAMMRPLYDDLPVIAVHEWEEITSERLAQWKADLASQWHTFKWEKLRTDYWRDLVRRVVVTGNVQSAWVLTEEGGKLVDNYV